jgi:hypothetical protein
MATRRKQLNWFKALFSIFQFRDPCITCIGWLWSATLTCYPRENQSNNHTTKEIINQWTSINPPKLLQPFRYWANQKKATRKNSKHSNLQILLANPNLAGLKQEGNKIIKIKIKIVNQK